MTEMITNRPGSRDETAAVQKRLYTTAQGHICLYMCSLWNGFSIWLNEVRLKEIPAETPAERTLKINYCLGGRCELKIESEGYFYLSKGQLAISSGKVQESYSYPTGTYDGIEFLLSFDDMADGLAGILEDIGFRFREISPAVLAIPSASLTKTLAELSENLKSENDSASFFRMLSLQVLYEIGAGSYSQADRHVFLTPGQREIARRAENDLTRNLTDHLTVEELASMYKVSPSSLKKYFAMSFGTNVTEYMQRYRCEKAASMLRNTGMKVGEIAEAVGYASQGKFDQVFKRIKGCSPLEYRRQSRLCEKRS